MRPLPWQGPASPSTLAGAQSLGVTDSINRCAAPPAQSVRPSRAGPGSALGLRYLRDRISCLGMPLHAGRLLRQALESTASLDGPEQPAVADP